MLKDKSLLDYTNLFSPDEYEKNDKIILKISITKKVLMKKIDCIKCKMKCKNSEVSYLFHKTLIISIICSKCASKH